MTINEDLPLKCYMFILVHKYVIIVFVDYLASYPVFPPGPPTDFDVRLYVQSFYVAVFSFSQLYPAAGPGLFPLHS